MSIPRFEHCILEKLYYSGELQGYDLLNSVADSLTPETKEHYVHLYDCLLDLRKKGLVSSGSDDLRSTFSITWNGIQWLQSEQEKELQLEETRQHDTKITFLNTIGNLITNNVGQLILAISKIISFLKDLL